MEEIRQEHAARSIDLTERSQSSSVLVKQPGDGASSPQESITPWFGNEAPSSFVSSMQPTDEARPVPIIALSAIPQVNLVSSSLPPSPLASVQNISPSRVPLSPIPSTWVSPAMRGVIERPEHPRISVLIPTRNEAANLPHVLPYMPAMVDEVILVDGHSTDDTIAVAQQLLPDIRIIKQTGKGKGDALRAGFAACMGDIIVTLDADGSADPREIPYFVAALMLGNDFAKGSRFVKGGGSRDITLFRSVGNFWLNKLVNMLFFAGFSDLCYGYNAFWRYCLDRIEVDCDGFEIEALINLRMHKANFRIIEVASFEYSRIHGESNLYAISDGWRVLRTILREWANPVFPRIEQQKVFRSMDSGEKVIK